MLEWEHFDRLHGLKLHNMKLSVRLSGGKFPWDVVVGQTIIHMADYPDKSIDTLDTAKAAAIKWAREWLARNVNALNNVK